MSDWQADDRNWRDEQGLAPVAEDGDARLDRALEEIGEAIDARRGEPTRRHVHAAIDRYTGGASTAFSLGLDGPLHIYHYAPGSDEPARTEVIEVENFDTDAEAYAAMIARIEEVEPGETCEEADARLRTRARLLSRPPSLRHLSSAVEGAVLEIGLTCAWYRLDAKGREEVREAMLGAMTPEERGRMAR